MPNDSNNISCDIERANSEMERLRQELRIAQSEVAKARIEGGEKLRQLARDFRIPLASVLGFTDLLSAIYKANP